MNLTNFVGLRMFQLSAFLSSSMLVTLFAPKVASSVPVPQKDEHFEQSFPVNPKGSTLEVNNSRGKIRITGSDQAQVTINVHKYFMGKEEDRARWMRETTVDFKNQPDRVAVTVHYPPTSCEQDCDQEKSNYVGYVELTIQVPRNTDIKLEGAKPEISVASLQGDIQITSEKSPIHIQSTTGAIQINTRKDIVKLNDVSIRGPLDINIENGKAEIDANNLDKEVNLETRKGSIVVRLPHNAGVNVDFIGGSRSYFYSDFSISGDNESKGAVHGVINQGGANIHMRTEKGSIFLLKMKDH
jgi:DUF4097 and DUF4098 domain-containing protein YvlB